MLLLWGEFTYAKAVKLHRGRTIRSGGDRSRKGTNCGGCRSKERGNGRAGARRSNWTPRRRCGWRFGCSGFGLDLEGPFLESGVQPSGQVRVKCRTLPSVGGSRFKVQGSRYKGRGSGVRSETKCILSRDFRLQEGNPRSFYTRRFRITVIWTYVQIVRKTLELYIRSAIRFPYKLCATSVYVHHPWHYYTA